MIKSSLRERYATLFLMLGLALALLAVPTSLALAAPVHTAEVPHSSTSSSNAHPYSDPRYLPLHSRFLIDCVRSNPGCKGGHRTWQMDLIPAGQYHHTGRPSHARVFAMGSGILHYGDVHGLACPARTTSYGTWVWIDHGAGTISRYGHLSKILVKNGTHVSAGQAIGVVGTTGKGAACQVNYTDVMVEHGGLQNANTIQIKTLRACTGKRSKPVIWPQAAHQRYTKWNDVRRHTAFPASTTNCLPKHAPNTAHRPARTSFVRSGAGRIVARWQRPADAANVDQVMVEMAAYHPSTKAWDESDHQTYRTTAAQQRSKTFTGLMRNHEYRMRVVFHNAAGWSHASPWRYATAT
jgi:hypothetical protein